MSEKEKEIIKVIAEALPKMSDFEKGRFLGRAEGMVDAKKKSSLKE